MLHPRNKRTVRRRITDSDSILPEDTIHYLEVYIEWLNDIAIPAVITGDIIVMLVALSFCFT